MQIFYQKTFLLIYIHFNLKCRRRICSAYIKQIFQITPSSAFSWRSIYFFIFYDAEHFWNTLNLVTVNIVIYPSKYTVKVVFFSFHILIESIWNVWRIVFVTCFKLFCDWIFHAGDLIHLIINAEDLIWVMLLHILAYFNFWCKETVIQLFKNLMHYKYKVSFSLAGMAISPQYK